MSDLPRSADVVVIGAGVLGLAAGYFLRKDGASVVVLDKGMAGWEASGRATGFLSLRGEQPLEVPLAAAAERLWATLDDELGTLTEWRPGGRLWVAIEPESWAELAQTCPLWRQAGVAVELVDAAAARKIAPCLGENTIGGMHTARGGHANPQRTTQAFAWAFQRIGGILAEFTPATDIAIAGGRIAAVQTVSGAIATSAVVACAGPQLGHIGRMVGVEIPVAPVRLEAMVTVPLPPLFEVAMVGNGLSLRQTRRGNIHFNGGPHEWIDVSLCAEPAKPNTPIIRNMTRRLAELFPSLAGVNALRSWAGVIEVTPDATVILDRPGAPEGFVVCSASGHGFGLAPAIGQALADLVVRGRSSIAIDGLGLDRFVGLPRDWRAARSWHAGSYNT